MMTYQMEEQCKLCLKIETKYGRIQKEEERIKRWRREKNRGASIEASEVTIEKLTGEMNDLMRRRADQQRSC